MILEHPLAFHAPGWHDTGHSPVVNGRYIDRTTGEAVAATDSDGHQEYMGPPAVDIIVMSIHEDTTQCVFRASLAFPMEALLGHIVTNVIRKRGLQLDSLTATPFAIRVVLAHPLTSDAFTEVALEMANGIWDDVDDAVIKPPTETTD